MPRVRFEPTTAVFERERTFHALDRAASVIAITVLMLTVNKTKLS
jgi:hypothetical protein